MENPMFSRVAVTFLLLCVVAFWSSSAFAATHDHHHGQHGNHNKIVSPFDKKQDTQSQHCALRNHAHYGFCSHDILNQGASKGFNIASDCGGKSSGTVPGNFQFGKTLVALSEFEENSFSLSLKKVMEILPSYDFHLVDPLAPPPRFI